MLRWLKVLALAMLSQAIFAEEIHVKKSGGIYWIPVEVNGVITVDFAIDSGAADVSVPMELFQMLKRTGTIQPPDMLPKGKVKIADGSVQDTDRFLIRKLKIGNTTLNNVKASTTAVGGPMLLGQSVLEKLPGWRLDATRELLVFNEAKKAAPVTTGDAFMDTVGIVDGVLDLDQELTRADFEGRQTGALPPRLLIVQERLTGLSARAAMIPESDPLAQPTQALLERYSSLVGLKVRGYEGESVSAQLSANEQLKNEQLKTLSDAMVQVPLKTGNLQYAASVMLMVAGHPELFFVKGRPYLGLLFGPAVNPDGSAGVGTMITTVFERSPAEDAGLKVGDVILSIDGVPAANTEATQRIFATRDSFDVQVKKLSGATIPVKLRKREYVPFGASTYTQICIISGQNESISPAASGNVHARLYNELSPMSTASNLVEVTRLSETKADAKTFEELSKAYPYTDYFLRFIVHEAQIESTTRMFKGQMRVGVYEVSYELYDARAGKVILKDRLEEMADKVEGDNEGTFSLLMHRMMQKWIPSIKSVVKYI